MIYSNVPSMTPMDEVTLRLQQARGQWTKKVDQIFSLCGVANTISTFGMLLILDPGRTESISAFPTPLTLWLPSSIIGLFILGTLRQLILHHIDERLLIGYSIVEKDDAALLYYHRSQSQSQPAGNGHLKYPFPYRFLWDILCDLNKI